MIDITKFTESICELGITPNQFYVLYCLKMGNAGWAKLYQFLHHVGNKQKEFFTYDELQYLIDEGFVINTHPKNAPVFDKLVVTDMFASKFFTDDPMEAADEFWEMYPSFFKLSNGQTGVTKSNVSEEEIKERYAKEIGKFKVLHERVLKMLKWAKKENHINYKIADFFLYYKDLLQMHFEKTNQVLMAGQEEVK